MRPLDQNKFIELYQQHALFGTLNDHQRGGLFDLLVYLEADEKVEDLRWAAYMLATVKWETAQTFLPVAEYGKGKGRKYGVPDARTGLVYYGRGYTQNTWYDNYKMLTVAWNKANPERPVDFTLEPDLLLNPEYSYWAMSYAMRHGSYTGVGLKKYINEEKCDYVNARRIINGTDKAETIAGYAVAFEELLRSAALQSTEGEGV